MYKLTENEITKISDVYKTIFENVDNYSRQNSVEIDKAKEKMKWAIRNVQLNDVFFAGVLNRMIPDNPNAMIRNDIPTMQTDGKRLFYSPKFVNQLSLSQVETVLVHELLHVALGHHLAFSDIQKNHKNLWYVVNLATDLAINHLLHGRTMPEGLLLPGVGEFTDMPKGLDARDYFERLVKKYTKQPEPPQQPQPQPQEPEMGDEDEDQDNDEQDSESGGESGDEGDDTEDQGEDQDGGGEGDDSQDGEDDAEGDGEGDGESDEGQDGEGAGGAGSGSGKGTGTGAGAGSGGESSDEQETGVDGGLTGYDQIEQQLDVPEDIIAKSQQTGEIESPEGVDSDNKQQELAKHDQEMEKEAGSADKVEEERASKGYSGTSGYGKGAGGLIDKDYRNAFKEKSNLPWANILANFLQSQDRTERNASVVNRRFSDYASSSGLIMPGYKEDKLKDLVFLVDVSGSMPRKACNKVFGEIRAVSENKVFGAGSTIRLVSFDDGVLSDDVFTAKTGDKYKSVANPKLFLDNKTHVHQLPLSNNVYNKFRWSGGGGGTQIHTSLLNLRQINPTLVVILTDGAFYDQTDREVINTYKLPYKIVWLMVTDIKFKQGVTYNLNDYNYDLGYR